MQELMENLLFIKKVKKLSVNQEVELKLIVNEKGYNSLIEQFRKIKIKEQKNFYFDTEDFSLNKRAATLRIRIEDNNINLTFKVKLKSLDNILREAMEYEIKLTEKEYLDIMNFPQSIIDYFSEDMTKVFGNLCNDKQRLMLLGSIENTRTYLEGYQKIVFELDKSVFPNDKIFYELEIENISLEVADEVMKYLKKMGVIIQVNNISKYNRFLNILHNV